MNNREHALRARRTLPWPLHFAAWLACAAAQAAVAQTQTQAQPQAQATAQDGAAANATQVPPQASGRAAASADQALPAVKVSASAVADSPLNLSTPVSSGALGTRSQLDTPFSTTVVTGEDLAERQVYKLGDVLAGDASVTNNSNAYNAWATYITIRGLPIDWQNGFRIDGNSVHLVRHHHAL